MQHKSVQKNVPFLFDLERTLQAKVELLFIGLYYKSFLKTKIEFGQERKK